MILFAMACQADPAPLPAGDATGFEEDSGEDPCAVGAGIDLGDLMHSYTGLGWSLVFNEIYAAPRTVDTASNPEETEGNDWLELYNRSDEPFSLEGVYLGDGENTADLTRFGILDARSRLFLFADGRVGAASVRLRLNDAGESLYLVRDGVQGEYVDVPEVSDVCSVSRVPDGSDTWALTSRTPGAANQ